MSEHKFPTEVIDLPSLGKVYPKGSPLIDGKIELKYMTTKEEDILMSQNLIKKNWPKSALLIAGSDRNKLSTFLFKE